MQRPRFGAALWCAGFLAHAAPAQRDAMPREGEVFPELELTMLDGESATLSRWRGRKVLLLQFASW